MASNPETVAPKLRWLRALVAAVVAELALICIAIPVYSAAADPTAILNMVVPPASGLLFLIAGYWAALPIPQRGIWQGVLTGVWAVALYLALGVGATVAGKGNVTDGFTPAYLLAHALKIAGGAVGGWLASRKAAPAA
jgi:hypothetical protein